MIKLGKARPTLQRAVLMTCSFSCATIQLLSVVEIDRDHVSLGATPAGVDLVGDLEHGTEFLHLRVQKWQGYVQVEYEKRCQ